MKKTVSLPAILLSAAAAFALVGCGDDKSAKVSEGGVNPDPHGEFVVQNLSADQKALAKEYFSLSDRFDKIYAKVQDVRIKIDQAPDPLNQFVDVPEKDRPTRHDIISDYSDTGRRTAEAAALRIQAIKGKEIKYEDVSSCVALMGIYESPPVDLGEHMKSMTIPELSNLESAATELFYQRLDLGNEFNITGFSVVDGARKRIAAFKDATDVLEKDVSNIEPQIAPKVRNIDLGSLALRGHTLQMDSLYPSCDFQLRRLEPSVAPK